MFSIDIEIQTQIFENYFFSRFRLFKTRLNKKYIEILGEFTTPFSRRAVSLRPTLLFLRLSKCIIKTNRRKRWFDFFFCFSAYFDANFFVIKQLEIESWNLEQWSAYYCNSSTAQNMYYIMIRNFYNFRHSSTGNF